jgi:hypothetical protein
MDVQDDSFMQADLNSNKRVRINDIDSEEETLVESMSKQGESASNSTPSSSSSQVNKKRYGSSIEYEVLFCRSHDYNYHYDYHDHLNYSPA